MIGVSIFECRRSLCMGFHVQKVSDVLIWKEYIVMGCRFFRTVCCDAACKFPSVDVLPTPSAFPFCVHGS